LRRSPTCAYRDAMSFSVLIIDDDRDLREAMRDILGHLGVDSCVLAASLEEVERAQDAVLGCRLAIVDINLGPRQPTGVDVVRWLQDRKFPGKIVFLTGHGQGDPRVMAAAEMAGTRLLSKPINAKILMGLVEEARGAG
jgi:FixJ family two-component response regulator